MAETQIVLKVEWSRKTQFDEGIDLVVNLWPLKKRYPHLTFTELH